MTVKEVFELRKQGKTEEAYSAIRAMYAYHKGKYTTLAMFWTANDVIKKRIEEKKFDEAQKILEAMAKVVSTIDDNDSSTNKAMLQNIILLKDYHKEFNVLHFLRKYDIIHLPPKCWKHKITTNGNVRTGFAQQIITRLFHELKENKNAEYALETMPYLETALSYNPFNKNNRRFMAYVNIILNNKENAIETYKMLTKRYKESFLYDEFSDIVDDKGLKAALLCKAIQNQKQEKFRSNYHLKLAKLLINRDNSKALYELNKCIEIRNKNHHKITKEICSMRQLLSNTTPSTYTEQWNFYKGMVEKYGKMMISET